MARYQEESSCSLAVSRPMLYPISFWKALLLGDNSVEPWLLPL